MQQSTAVEQLICEIFEAYEQFYGDAKVAAVATMATLNELLIQQTSRAKKPVRNIFR